MTAEPADRSNPNDRTRGVDIVPLELDGHKLVAWDYAGQMQVGAALDCYPSWWGLRNTGLVLCDARSAAFNPAERVCGGGASG